MAVIANKRSVMTLYSEPNDAYSHLVRIVLGEKGVVYDMIEVDPYQKPQELLEINPYGTAPTLLDRDLVLFNADIISEYLDERFPHPPLMPVYPVARARSRLMMYRIDNDWYALMKKILAGGPAVEEARKELRDSMLSVVPLFNEMPYFLSEEFSLIDCALAPLMWRLGSLGITLPPEAKAIEAYTTRIFERESFKASLTEAERILGAA